MFKFNWIITNKLALGSYPKTKDNFIKLKNNNIKSILCLCNEEEVNINLYETQSFNFNRKPLPDHRSGRLPTKKNFKKL